MQFEEFNRIQTDIAQQLKYDDMNINDFALALPSYKHYWVARLIEYKLELKKLTKKKAELLEILSKKYDSNTDIQLSKNTIIKMLNSNETVTKLNDRLDELDIIIEYLEKVEKIYSQATFDLKNTIELQKLEQS